MNDLMTDDVPTAVLRVLVAIHGDETSDGDDADLGADVPTTGRSAARPTDVGNAHGGVPRRPAVAGRSRTRRNLVGSAS